MPLVDIDPVDHGGPSLDTVLLVKRLRLKGRFFRAWYREPAA
jgi:hypothetical protein